MAHMEDPPGGLHVHHEGGVTSVDVSGRDDVHQLKGSAVGLVGVLFLCVTGSAPLAVVLFNMPYVMPLGSEWGGPAAFFFATIVLTIFSVSYVEMCKKVRAAGGMYTFVSHGLGRELGFMAGFSLLVAYTIFSVSLIGGFAKFTQLKLDQYDIGVPWIYIALFGVLCCLLLAYYDVEISVKVLGAALLGELAVILIMSFGILGQGGSDGLSVEPILPWNAFQGIAPGIGIFFAFWSWVGFEAAPNYAEESRDPVRIIPLAVYFSCIAVGTLYTIAAWAILSGYGPKNQITEAFNNGTSRPADPNGDQRARVGGQRRHPDVLPNVSPGRAVRRRRHELPDHHRRAGLRHGARQRGRPLLVRDGTRGHPAQGARAHPPHAQVAVHRPVLDVHGRDRPAARLLVHRSRAAGGLRLDGGAGRDLDPARAGAGGPVDVLLLPQALPGRDAHRSRRSSRRGSRSSPSSR